MLCWGVNHGWVRETVKDRERAGRLCRSCLLYSTRFVRGETLVFGALPRERVLVYKYTLYDERIRTPPLVISTRSCSMDPPSREPYYTIWGIRGTAEHGIVRRATTPARAWARCRVVLGLCSRRLDVEIEAETCQFHKYTTADQYTAPIPSFEHLSCTASEPSLINFPTRGPNSLRELSSANLTRVTTVYWPRRKREL